MYIYYVYMVTIVLIKPIIVWFQPGKNLLLDHANFKEYISGCKVFRWTHPISNSYGAVSTWESKLSVACISIRPTKNHPECSQIVWCIHNALPDIIKWCTCHDASLPSRIPLKTIAPNHLLETNLRTEDQRYQQINGKWTSKSDS